MPNVAPSPETQGETKLPEVLQILRSERLQAKGAMLKAMEIVDHAKDIADLSYQRLFAAVRRLNHVDRELRAHEVVP